jgi:DNA processing protein
MRIEEKYLLLTHVASQIIGRWFPAPRVSPEKMYGQSGLSEPTFRDLIEWDLADDDPVFKWLWPYVESGRVTLRALIDAAERHIDHALRDDGHLIFIDSPRYPVNLRAIARPPLVLSALGQLDSLPRRSVGVIGSRRASYESLKASVDVGRALARHGFTVVSGGAIGCDIAAHEGVLSEPGSVGAVVVFAGGLSSRFPRCNERTFNEILERGGVLLSERLWSQRVMPYDFPARNRLISGISESVVVMGASLRSGTMVTAREALEQGRDVYVFDHSLSTDIRMEGSSNLSQDGALLFERADELMGFLSCDDGDFDENPPGPCNWVADLGKFNTEKHFH